MKVRHASNVWVIRRLWLPPRPEFPPRRVRRIENTPAPYGFARYHWWSGAQAGPLITDLAIALIVFLVSDLKRLIVGLLMIPPQVIGLRPSTIEARSKARVVRWRVPSKDVRKLTNKVRGEIARGVAPENILRECQESQRSIRRANVPVTAKRRRK